MASMGSSPFWNIGTIRPVSGWENSDCCIVEPDKVNHTVVTEMMKLVVKIECFGISFDDFDKETGLSVGLQLKQADQNYVHALNELHLMISCVPNINARKKAPPNQKNWLVLTQILYAVKYPKHPLILVGKSMGSTSRISCMVAARTTLSYIKPVKKARNGVIRDETLLPLQVRKQLKAFNNLHVTEYGDHSFQIAKKNLELGMTHEEAEEGAVKAIAVIGQELGTKRIDNSSPIHTLGMLHVSFIVTFTVTAAVAASIFTFAVFSLLSRGFVYFLVIAVCSWSCFLLSVLGQYLADAHCCVDHGGVSGLPPSCKPNSPCLSLC
ncbi:KAT8 regulatory NSL complex subunit 3-like protein [Tanacetum coccineum]